MSDGADTGRRTRIGARDGVSLRRPGWTPAHQAAAAGVEPRRDDLSDPPAVRIVVVDDQPLARAGCRLALEAGEGLAVAGEADCRSVMTVTIELQPDVVVVHGRRQGVEALEVTRWIRAEERLATTRVIVFAAPGWDVMEALRARVCGVLSPDAQADELRRAVRAVAAGGAFLAPSAARRLMTELAGRVAVPSPQWCERAAMLTERERDVVAAVARGLTNEAIGRQLHMSPATARTHVSRALVKLGLRGRSQLVVLAYEAGLVTPGTDPETN